MRTFKIIQKVIAVVAMAIAISLGNGMDATSKEIGISFLITVLAILMLLSEHFYTLKKGDEK